MEESVRGGNRDRAPVINVRDFNLQKYEGKVVMIAFWQARECPTCEAYIPWLADMQGRYGSDGLVIVAVNQDLESASATDMVSKIHSRSQVVLDPTRKMAASYQIEGVPSTYLYDRNLNLTDKFSGFVKEETESMEKAVEKLLEKKYKD
jgi:thiol-disulfide isomerase/thioredoxin